MPKKINTEMDPIIEITGLLVASCNKENIRPEMIKALDELVLDGDAFYSRHLKIYDRYTEEFGKTCQLSEGYEFFFQESNDTNFILIPLSLITDNRDMLPDIDSIDDSVINNEILEISKSVFDIKTSVKTIDTLDDAMKFLAESSLGSNDKWRLIRLMQNPRRHLRQFMNIINSNMKAYEKAVNCVKPDLSELICKYEDLMRDENNGQFSNLKTSLSQSTSIYPTLAFPISLIAFGFIQKAFRVHCEGQGHPFRI